MADQALAVGELHARRGFEHAGFGGQFDFQGSSEGGETPNTRRQAPNTKEAPSIKHQKRLFGRAPVWSLELGIWLVFGVWFLVFSISSHTDSDRVDAHRFHHIPHVTGRIPQP